MKKVFLAIIMASPTIALAQSKPATNNYVSKVWVADQGNGTYKNPILNADYSDPDAIRVGEDYYMVSSSFEDTPGLPVLHSKDLVNWKLIGHALTKLTPTEHFNAPRHGEGVWAPAIRYYNNEFYIYYPDPDFGIYLIKAKNAAGPWSKPELVLAGKGLIDPCPLVDDDGRMYMVHGYAGSRAGVKSIISVCELNKAGNKQIGDDLIVYDGHELDPTVEGPKFYKKNGYYYIFAPAGGVPTGWQLVLRSKNVYGPYERKVVMDQGKTPINGPHQGAWVNTPTGEDWFLHFQDKDAYGRVVHLQPMKWKRDWPVIGVDADGDGKGEPVLTFKKPSVGKVYPIQTPAESDEFNGNRLGLQWQWMANAKPTWYYLNQNKGELRLYSENFKAFGNNLWSAPNALLQKFPAEEFQITTKLNFTPNSKLKDERVGLTIMGLNYAAIALQNTKDGLALVYGVCATADKGNEEKIQRLTKFEKGDVWFRVQVALGGQCQFSYSLNGKDFIDVKETFKAEVGKWKGAKVGLFCVREDQTNDSGYADIDWFRVEPIGK